MNTTKDFDAALNKRGSTYVFPLEIHEDNCVKGRTKLKAKVAYVNTLDTGDGAIVDSREGFKPNFTFVREDDLPRYMHADFQSNITNFKEEMAKLHDTFQAIHRGDITIKDAASAMRDNMEPSFNAAIANKYPRPPQNQLEGVLKHNPNFVTSDSVLNELRNM